MALLIPFPGQDYVIDSASGLARRPLDPKNSPLCQSCTAPTDRHDFTAKLGSRNDLAIR